MAPRAIRRRAQRKVCAIPAVAALAIVAAHGAEAASAKTFEVKRGADRGHGTLRQAVRSADRHPGLDRIVFASKVRRVRLRGDIEITDSLILSPRRRVIAGRATDGTGDRPVLEFGRGRSDEQLIIRRAFLRRTSVYSTDRLTVSDSRFLGPGDGSSSYFGIAAVGPAPKRILRTRISGFESGVRMRGTKRAVIADSRISENETGIAISSGVSRITGSVITGNETGIGSSQARFYVVESAVTDNGPDSGIWGGFPNVLRSTITRNEGARGGGIRTDTAVVRNSTISGNAATGSAEEPGRGGGIFIGNYGYLEISGSTVTGNTAAAAGGGVYVASPYYGDKTEVSGSILAANSSPTNADCGSGRVGQVLSEGGNVFGPEGCGPGNPSDALTSTPGIGPLADNGGPTPTHALLPGSPAIGNAEGLELPTDQRGVPRDADPDSGAFEFQAP